MLASHPMRSAVRGAARARVATPLSIDVPRLTAALVVSSAAVLGSALVFSGGLRDDRLAVIGGAAVLLCALAAAASFLGRLPRPSASIPGRIFLVVLTALVAWTGASVVWSILPDLSWA